MSFVSGTPWTAPRSLQIVSLVSASLLLLHLVERITRSFLGALYSVGGALA